MVCLLVAGAIGYYGASMLLAKSLKVFRGSWKGLLAVLAGCALVCCVLHFDLLGVADRVPEASQIQTLEVRTADNSYTLTPEQDGDLVEQIRAIHQAIVADKAHVQALDDSRDLTLSEEADPNTTHTGLRLTYSLNNGTRVERWYYLPITRDRLAQPETYDHLLDQFVNSDIVKARRLHLNDDFWTVSSGSLYLEARGESYDLGSREASAVLQAVGRDLASGGWGNYDWFSSSDSDSYAIYLELGFDGPDGEGHDWISINAVSYTHLDVYKRQHYGHVVAEVGGEQGPDGPVDDPAGEDALLAGTALPPVEGTGDAAHGVQLLLKVHAQGEEINAVPGTGGRGDAAEDPGVAIAHHDGGVGQLGHLAHLHGEGTAGQVHLILVVAGELSLGDDG